MSQIKNFIHDHNITTNDELKKHLTRINKLSSNDKNLDFNDNSTISEVLEKDVLDKFTNYEDNVSITTDFLIRNYVSDTNIGYLPNTTSLISFASSYINRTEKWALFASRYNPTYSELIIGSGPFQINNYYYWYT